MKKLIVIKGELPTLNDYTKANRVNKYVGAQAKKLATMVCEMATKEAMSKGLTVETPFSITCHWYTKNNRKDHDNVAFGIKFIQDGMMAAGLMENDGPKQVGNIHHLFQVDKDNPRVEVEIGDAE